MRYLAAVALVALVVTVTMQADDVRASMNTFASKCTGKDPCPACSNCEHCGFCKNGRTCGTCKPKDKGKRVIAYFSNPVCR